MNEVMRVRHDLLKDRSPALQARRAIIGLSTIGLLDFVAISLYQTGILNKLPDLPGRFFDSNKVNGSKKAYSRHLPDGLTGALLYVTHMILASYGAEFSRRRAWSRWALVASTSAGVFGAATYLYDMSFRQKRACIYCLIGAAINLLLLRRSLSSLWSTQD